MAIAFLGLLCIQIFYMRNIVQIRYEQFAQGVRQSLVAVSQRLEQDEARHYLEDDVRQVEMSALMSQYIGDNPNRLGGIKYSFTTRTGLEADLTIKGDISEINNIQTSGGMGAHYRSMQDAYRNRYLYQRDMLDDVILYITMPVQSCISHRITRLIRSTTTTCSYRHCFPTTSTAPTTT